MTLLEVVVALAISGMAVAAAIAAFHAVLQIHEDGARFAAEIVRCESMRGALSSWIRGAVLHGGETDHFRGLSKEIPDGEADELTLLTTADTPGGSGEVEFALRLVARDATHGAGLLAEFRTATSDRVETIMLDTTVRSLRISYLVARDSVNRWVPGWISGSALPRAVQIRIETGRFDDSRCTDAPADNYSSRPFPMGRRSAGTRRPARNGYVLIAVIWLTVLLMAMAFEVSRRARLERLATLNIVDDVVLTAALDASVERARSLLCETAAGDAARAVRSRSTGRFPNRFLGWNLCIPIRHRQLRECEVHYQRA